MCDSRCQQLTNENTFLKEELAETRRMLLSRNEYSLTELYKKTQSIKEKYQKLKDNIKDQNTGIIEPWKLDSQYSFPAEKDYMEMKKRIDDLEEENRRLVHDKWTMEEKQKDALRQKESELSSTKRKLGTTETELKSIRSRNQRLQDELNKLNVKIRHLEENRMDTTDEWKHLVEIKDTVRQLEKDNDQLKQKIDTLSKENRSALSSNKRLENGNGQMLLATDESKRWQEKIKELQNEIGDLRRDLSKQKEDAIKRIRDLECVNASYNDQLLLATDESERLQGRIKDLQGENSRLRRDIDDLSKQKEDALTRLSKVAGAKLTHGNAAIIDLSDTDRPTKLAEKFSGLYDNAWTDAFEELDNTFHNEEETIKVLLRIFQEAYKFCVETETNYETRIEQAVFTLASKTESHQIKNANVEIQKVLADLRISLSTACCSVIEEMVLSKLPSILKSVDVAACPLTKLFARQCASLSWKMTIRDPPLFVRFEFRSGSTFNADELKRYTKTGGYLDFLVWPTLYLHENGPVLAKGVAQSKIAP